MEEQVEGKSMETESSSSSDGEENELELRAEELERQVLENQYLYDVHVELVELYRKLGDLTSMRSAYERFSKFFPLTPTLWLAWIQDEIKLAHSSADNKQILNLFNRAVEDYQSVKLWQEYAQFAIGSCTPEETRAILERGLNSVGVHVAEGSLLWDTSREFELAHLSLAEPDSEGFQTQLLKVVDVFRRQLSVPLLDMEETHDEWQNFVKQLPDDHGIDTQSVEWSYNNALKTLDVYKPFEKKLLEVEDDADLYVVCKEYIKAIKDPNLVLCTYERFVAQLCLNVTLWEDYCYFSLKLGDAALKVSRRSVRNCPWHVQLWIIRLRILEHLKQPDKDVLECFEDAIKSVPGTQVLDLWLAYIEYVKRTSDDVDRLNKIFEQAKQQVTFEYDQTSKISRLQARFAALRNDIASARKIWSDIVRNPQNKTSGNMWVEYIALERRFGEPKQLRSLFQRAIANCKDWQQYFVDEWMMFEREVGTLQDVLNCVEKSQSYAQPIQYDHYHDGNSALLNTKKRNLDEDNGRSHYKKQKTFDNVDKARGFSRKKTEVVKDDKMEVDAAKKTEGPPVDLEPAKTIFVSNLASKVDEDKLREMFKNSVKITIPTKRGVSRCFAYVQFENESEAQDALGRDREPLDGRPVFISECKLDRTQRKSAFKYSDKIEYNKLFVKGLPKFYTKENIESIFKPYSPTDIRLVRKFNGQFKGLAYVDFANDEDAEKALKDVNGIVVGEHTLTVAVSAPPSKKAASPNAKTDVSTTNRLPARNSKSRLEIPFVPRSVQVKKNVEEVVQNVAKTNDDFRKLLLNK